MSRLLGKLAEIPVSQLDGVGAKKIEGLEKVGVQSVLDLLFHYPRRYIDRTKQRQIVDLQPGEEALVLGEVVKIAGRRTRNGRALVEAQITDGSGTLSISFFNQPWRTKQLLGGEQAVFFGKVDVYRGRRQMTNPIVDLVGDQTGRVVPVYPQSEKAGLTTREIARWVQEALKLAGDLADPLNDEYRKSVGVVARNWAMHQVHAPEEVEMAYSARKRLAFDELLRLQALLVLRKRAIERESRGIAHEIDGDLSKRFFDTLPFPLTGAQQRVIDEIASDMARPLPMHRLLQGDVGSGKTIVAVAALLTAVQGCHQGALMAPTAVLAEQHFVNVRNLLEGLSIVDTTSLLSERPVKVALLTNRTTAAERKVLHAGLRSGEVDILIGTHALLTEQVEFNSLAAVVIDEQHRFGVEQRSVLREKGSGETVPDVLVMTATPIPRTAAMTVYGDLDVSVLDEMPPGRTPIKTMWARNDLLEQSAWKRLRTETEAGRQAYVVCPLVEESDKIQSKSATAEFERLQEEELKGLRLGLLHGQMHANDKEDVMNGFRAGELDVLVATTVIEVGVDVPNATVMVIEDAGRFGIAQLHQLRGRVGRGANESYCFLLGDVSEDSEERLAAVERTTDGFDLADVDLEIRGAGSILGARQSGRSDLKLATLKKRDRELVKKAREIAFEIIDADPQLQQNRVLLDDVSHLIDEDEATFLFKS